MLAARRRFVQHAAVALRICRRQHAHSLAACDQCMPTAQTRVGRLLPATAAIARGFASGMDAFMEFEREMARKRMQNEPRARKLQRAAPLSPPVKPKDDECCKLDCPNCVLLVYQEKLLEYELSQQQQPKGGHARRPSPPKPKYDVQFLEPTNVSPAHAALLHDNDLGVFAIAANDEISESHRTRDDWWRSVRHIDLLVAAHQQRYVGDDASNIAVFVPNSAAVVDRMLAHLHVDPDVLFTAEPIHSSHTSSSHSDQPAHAVPRPFERIGSVRDALTWSFDLEGAPRPRLFKALAAYASDADDVDALSMPNALEALKAERAGQSVSVADLFDRFASLQLTFDAFVQVAPPNAPRYYTVSSSRHFSPDRVALTLGLKQRAEQPAPRCSSYLAALEPGRDTVRAAFFHSTFVYPRTDRLPILLVSAGTGIAPFRAFLQDLEHERAEDDSSATHRRAVLFYGCRSPTIDFLYGDEVRDAHARGVLDELHVAFSSAVDSDDDGAPSSRYVQGVLAAQSAMVVRHLVHDCGHVFVCGSLAMGRAVKQTIARALVAHGEAEDERTAKARVTQWLESGQIVTELW